ncbi:MAG TPA: hypothetical protein VF771_09190, partial [Longimicrobiaceae bacterium]
MREHPRNIVVRCSTARRRLARAGFAVLACAIAGACSRAEGDSAAAGYAGEVARIVRPVAVAGPRLSVAAE